jgi:hypothetical protein
MMMHRLHTSVAALALLTVTACSAPSAQVPADEAAVVAALIVKPKIATSDSSAVLKPIRATLGQTAGVRYVRPMAADLHMVYLTAPAQRSEVPQLVERLRASGAFQYVEVDSMLKIQ